MATIESTVYATSKTSYLRDGRWEHAPAADNKSKSKATHEGWDALASVVKDCKDKGWTLKNGNLSHRVGCRIDTVSTMTWMTMCFFFEGTKVDVSELYMQVR